MRFLPVLAIVCGLAIATPLHTGNYAVKETHPVPREFTRISSAPGTHSIRLQVAVKQSRFDELEKHLYEISDPDHDRYGQHLTTAEINELVKPSDNALSAVQEWLHEHIDPASIDYTPARDFVSFTVPVEKAERLLDTEYSVYRHDDGTHLIRTPRWSLPAHLHKHIEAIQPTTSFLRAVPQARTYLDVPGANDLQIKPSTAWPDSSVDVVCDTAAVTPDCLRTLYGTIDYKAQVPGKNVMALTDYLGEINNRSDTEIYLKNYRPDAISAAYTFSQISIAGGTLQQTPENATQLYDETGVEGNLDVETLLGIGYPTPLVAYSTGEVNPPFSPDADNPTVDNEPYLTWLNYVLAQPFVPQVISNSYEDNEQTVPASYAKVVCNGFAQLGARGVSVFFGSGDGGVSGVQPGGACKSNVNNQTQFTPLFPSSCPYITSVGATVNFNPEVVAYDPRNEFASGGGFSNYFPQPSYQKQAVSHYLPHIPSNFSAFYNASGRAYPDIAAYGVNFTVIWDGKLELVDGTSAATPALSAVFAMLNDALLAAGKPTMGFLNPWLYKKGHMAFTDVTSGSTIGCGTTGFEATKGWDAASGFGTPVSRDMFFVARKRILLTV
ncbi:tripeptidyl peptidase-like protein [Teratosphaeria nubilosa]|uniref:tripeptidyl-peptidase II n=1 Tax=Teratosphaeria nubilosa TaxID=161662 RepID=A0A6G1L8Z6_9PEZI|nr:tripeptidyl peptidase-like protein [Teratosphaeria nubilosa]